MLLKLGVVLIVLSMTRAQKESPSWELAVVTGNKIELLRPNGSMVGAEIIKEFVKLKALTYDNIRHEFVVSDMNGKNDTIYTVNLTKEKAIYPIIEDLPDNIKGLAIDPVEDVLYWIDSDNHTINYLSLKDETFERKTLFHFENSHPQAVVVDACRRYIYWTNSYPTRATIERAKIGSDKPEVLVDEDLIMPHGITIDYKQKRLYWTDWREGIYYRIESTDLLGKDRRKVYSGTHSEPFGITVDDDSVFWTDTVNLALWRIPKAGKSEPDKIRNFHEKPMGLISKKVQIKDQIDCENIEAAILSYDKPVEEYFPHVDDDRNETETTQPIGDGKEFVKAFEQLNDGHEEEVSKCHNFCIHGSCSISEEGLPQCDCFHDFGGTRCDESCNGFCMNEGKCSFDPQNGGHAMCNCTEGFRGTHCEESLMIEKLCYGICKGGFREDDLLNEKTFCRCTDSNLYGVESGDFPQSLSLSEDLSSHCYYFKDTIFILLIVVSICTFITCLGLTFIIINLRRKPKPRLKRRYIVNKNSTSLASLPPEQCEITIENCCNMNVCDTPCYEPSQLHRFARKNDDKKCLLPISNEDLR